MILLDEPTSVLERAEIDILFARVRALQGARLLRLRLAPARRGAGALRPRLRDEGRGGGGRAAGGRGGRADAAPADGRPRPAGGILPRAAAEAAPRPRWSCEATGPGARTAPTATSSFDAARRRDPRHRRRHRLRPRGADPHAGRLRAARRRARSTRRRPRCASRTPAEAVDRGIGYIPRERRTEGLVLFLPVAANITLAEPRPASTRMGLIEHGERAPARHRVGRAAEHPHAGRSTRSASTSPAATSRRWCWPSG